MSGQLVMSSFFPDRMDTRHKMRVLHVFKTYLPETTGGIEQVIFQLCQGGLLHGIHSQVLALSPNPRPLAIQVAGHRVIRAREDFSLASTGVSLQAFPLFRRLARQVDLVHFHFPWPWMDLLHFYGRAGKPCVLSYHSDIVRQRLLLQLYQPLMWRFLSRMDRIVVASPNYLASSPVLRHYPETTRVIPFGLERAAYPLPSPQRLAGWRQQLGAMGEKFFLFVGVLRYYKGLCFALEALQDTGYPLVILGSGPEEERLKQQARQLGLNNVLFLGRLSDEDKVCLLQLCLAMVFPSHLRSEAFGISLLEAAMYGKPMISCEIGTGTSFINQHEETGLVVLPESPVALRQAMTRLWNNPQETAHFGQNALMRFEAQFSASQMCTRMAALYHEICTQAVQ